MLFFFFNDTATTEIYTLPLHDALPIFNCSVSRPPSRRSPASSRVRHWWSRAGSSAASTWRRSEEHTSELQSRSDLVCRLLLEKKKMARACISVLAWTLQGVLSDIAG